MHAVTTIEPQSRAARAIKSVQAICEKYGAKVLETPAQMVDSGKYGWINASSAFWSTGYETQSGQELRILIDFTGCRKPKDCMNSALAALKEILQPAVIGKWDVRPTDSDVGTSLNIAGPKKW